MSCVDAAIIKALVEHIGGNPDDVVGGSSNTDIPVDNVSWKLENKDLGSGEKPVYVATTEMVSTIRPGHIFKLETDPGVITNYLCITQSDEILWFIDSIGNLNFSGEKLSAYPRQWGFTSWDMQEEHVPDQITTGIFRINSIESASFAIQALTTYAARRIETLASNQ